MTHISDVEEVAESACDTIHDLIHAALLLHGFPHMHVRFFAVHEDGAIMTGGCLALDKVPDVCRRMQESLAEQTAQTTALINKVKDGSL